MHSAKLLFQNPWGYNLWLSFIFALRPKKITIKQWRLEKNT